MTNFASAALPPWSPAPQQTEQTFKKAINSSKRYHISYSQSQRKQCIDLTVHVLFRLYCHRRPDESSFCHQIAQLVGVWRVTSPVTPLLHFHFWRLLTTCTLLCVLVSKKKQSVNAFLVTIFLTILRSVHTCPSVPYVCPGGLPVPLHSRALMDLAMNSPLTHNLQRAR
jgi:hypothetical protein